VFIAVVVGVVVVVLVVTVVIIIVGFSAVDDGDGVIFCYC
jgi:hypothetical protein